MFIDFHWTSYSPFSTCHIFVIYDARYNGWCFNYEYFYMKRLHKVTITLFLCHISSFHTIFMPQLLNSLLSLTRERKMLSKQVHKKFSRKGREELYLKWGIDLKTKHRSIQLAWLIWTDTRDLNHIRESAALVAKLVGFINTGETSKKTFGFGFLTRSKSKNSPSWKDTMSTLK